VVAPDHVTAVLKNGPLDDVNGGARLFTDRESALSWAHDVGGELIPFTLKLDSLRAARWESDRSPPLDLLGRELAVDILIHGQDTIALRADCLLGPKWGISALESMASRLEALTLHVPDPDLFCVGEDGSPDIQAMQLKRAERARLYQSYQLLWCASSGIRGESTTQSSLPRPEAFLTRLEANNLAVEIRCAQAMPAEERARLGLHSARDLALEFFSKMSRRWLDPRFRLEAIPEDRLFLEYKPLLELEAMEQWPSEEVIAQFVRTVERWHQYTDDPSGIHVRELSALARLTAEDLLGAFLRRATRPEAATCLLPAIVQRARGEPAFRAELEVLAADEGNLPMSGCARLLLEALARSGTWHEVVGRCWRQLVSLGGGGASYS
jgi:hypothetical protein